MKNLLAAILTGIVLSGSIGCNSRNGEFSEEAFLRDSTQYERFQYFDYYTLSGKGEVTDTPYVFVKREKDRITVRLSDSLPQAYIFNKMGDYWHIRQEYDMEYADFGLCLCVNGPEPRRFDRYIKNDSIFEVLQFFCGDSTTLDKVRIYTPNNIYQLRYDLDTIKSDESKIRIYLNNVINAANFQRGSMDNIGNKKFFIRSIADSIHTIYVIGGKKTDIFPKRGLSMYGVENR